jgi:hypothetical protein
MPRPRKLRIKCPNCLSGKTPHEIPIHFPWYLAPLRWLVHSVRCDGCLTKYYRVRFLGWMFRRPR